MADVEIDAVREILGIHPFDPAGLAERHELPLPADVLVEPVDVNGGLPQSGH